MNFVFLLDPSAQSFSGLDRGGFLVLSGNSWQPYAGNSSSWRLYHYVGPLPALFTLLNSNAVGPLVVNRRRGVSAKIFLSFPARSEQSAPRSHF